MKLKMDKKMLPMKAHFFFYNAGFAPVVPFMPTLARQLGFSSVAVGTVYTILPIVGFLVKPLIGAITDKLKKHKMFLLLSQILMAVAFMGIKFIKPIDHSAQMQLHCNDGVADLKYCAPSGTGLDTCLYNSLMGNDTINTLLTCKLTCTVKATWMAEAICRDWQSHTDLSTCDTKRTTFELIAEVPMKHIESPSKECLYFLLHTGHMIENGVTYPISCPKQSNNSLYFKTDCSGHCDDGIAMQLLTEQAANEIHVLEHSQFWLFLGFMVLSWSAMAVICSLGDTICFQMLGDQHNRYGFQRMWGSIGFGIAALLSGLLVDEMSRGQSMKDYSGIYYMMICLVALDLICSSRLKHIQIEHSSQLLKDVGVLFRSPTILVFFMWCFVIGMCTSLIWHFLFWYMEELADAEPGCQHMEWMKTLQGLVSAVQCFGGELPFFFVSGWVLHKIGHIHSMSLVLLVFAVRFLLYSVLSNPWWVLPIELLQGATFSILYATMVSYASLVAPAGAEATMQGLVGAIFEGLGVSGGSLIGGLLIDWVGASQMFRIFGYVTIACLVVHIMVQKLIERSAVQSDADAMRTVAVDKQSRSGDYSIVMTQTKDGEN